MVHMKQSNELLKSLPKGRSCARGRLHFDNCRTLRLRADVVCVQPKPPDAITQLKQNSYHQLHVKIETYKLVLSYCIISPIKSTGHRKHY